MTLNILFAQPDSISRIAAEAFLNSLWQSAALALFVWVLLLLFKRASAAVKYGVWLAALVAIVCLPFLNALTSYRKPTINDVVLYKSPQSERATQPTAVIQNAPQSPIASSSEGASEHTGAVEGDAALPIPVRAEELSLSSHQSASETAPESRAHEEAFSIRLGGDRWPQLFLLLWLLGALLMLLRLSRSYLSLRRLKRASQPLANNFQERLLYWSRSCGVRRTVGLRGSKQIALPLMLGLRKPSIIFPEKLAESLAEDEFDQVLLHELAHVRRRDDWGNLAQKLIEALLFFHPVVWWVGRQLSAERECACDQWVVSVTGERRSYASCLAKLFELTRRPRPALLAPGAMTVKSHLSRRIETILKSKERLPASLRAVSFFLPLCLLLFAMIHLGRLSPLITVSASGNSSIESAEQGTQAGTALSEQSRPGNDETDRQLEDSLRGIEVGDNASFLNNVGDTIQLKPESSAGSERLELSASPRGELPEPRSWLVSAEVSGNIAPAAAQPLAFILPVVNRQTAMPNAVAQSNSRQVTPEPAALQTVTSSDDGSLPVDFFKTVAALGNSASQREILTALIKRRGLTKENLLLSLLAAKSIDSDGDKAEFLVGAAGVSSSDTDILNAFFSAVSSINSAGERRRVLVALLAAKGRERAVLIRILKAAASINSDGEKAELLVKVTSLYAIDGEMLSAFLEATSAINSSGEQRRALTAILRQKNLSHEVIIQTLRFARRISSDGEKAEFLERAAELCPINDGVMSAYLATVSSINSSGERARALSAISKRRELGRAAATQTTSLARNSDPKD